MSQIKNRTKITAGDLSKMEINNMPDREFKEMVIKALTLDLRQESVNHKLREWVGGAREGRRAYYVCYQQMCLPKH